MEQNLYIIQNDADDFARAHFFILGCTELTLWMMGNFLKVDYIVVCFFKPLNSAWILLGMVDQVANRLDLRPAAELLGGWLVSNLFE